MRPALALAALLSCVGTPAAKSPEPQPPPPSGDCQVSALLSSLGKTNMMIGGAMADATANAAKFDVRYLYLAGGIADGAGPCASCASGCASKTTTCASSGPGCAWWGCWQWDQVKPGDYARSFISGAQGRSEIPMFTYYEILQASGVSEGSAEVTQAATNASFMARYLSDYRFLLQQIGTQPALLHVEPDFWGYAQQVSSDPTKLPAAVASANATDCGALPDTIAGLGKCFVAMARKYAPNAKVGLHASAWSSGIDVYLNTNASIDVTAEAAKTAAFLAAAGATAMDFIAVEASDRDAGYYQSTNRNTWWDATNATLPSFHQAFAWSGAVASRLGIPAIHWQLPLGNAQQSNTNDHWKDNRVDYYFAHLAELQNAHAAAILFGAGAGGQTTPESDGGHFLKAAQAYLAAPVRACQ